MGGLGRLPCADYAPHVGAQKRARDFIAQGFPVGPVGRNPTRTCIKQHERIKSRPFLQMQTNYYIKRRETTGNWINKMRGFSPNLINNTIKASMFGRRLTPLIQVQLHFFKRLVP